jgi:lipopolysaccharide transport system ATP-binding protein
MSSNAITIEKLSKAYRIATSHRTNDTLVSAAKSLLTAPWRKFQQIKNLDTSKVQLDATKSNDDKSLYWALRDVSFDIQQGDVVGLIGRNGAGKSTLLKVLSRITEPTNGQVSITGRVSSLLEVGTGFHPELTGRENIYMNGTILGMKKREIDRKFDEIVSFSGVEQFLDVPIKNYSSGMQVRLAFAVAANLEPEILIVDEVLAVGDAEFQKKCIGKMQDVSKGGRTVLFVSHNMSVLQSLCTRGYILTQGKLTFGGDIREAVGLYLKGLQVHQDLALEKRPDRRGKGEFILTNIRISMSESSPQFVLATGQPAIFEFELNKLNKDVDINFIIHDQWGAPISYVGNWPRSPLDITADTKPNTIRCLIENLPLRAGRYHILVQVNHGRELQDLLESAAYFDVENCDFHGRSLPYPNVPGVVCIKHQWTSAC